MADGQLIDEIISPSAKKDLADLIDKLDEANKKMAQAASNAINLKVDVSGTASLAQLLSVTAKVDSTIDGLAQKSKEYVQNVKTLAQAATEASKQATEAAKQETEAKKQLNTESKTTILLKKEEERLTRLAEKQAEAVRKQTSEYAKLNEEYKKAAQLAKDMGAQQIRLRNEIGGGTYSGADLIAKKQELSNLNTTLIQAQANAKKLSEQLYSIEIAVGQGQRKVGQYNEAARGLRDILRDTPAFAFSFATGIEAISNNIPQLTDGIRKMQEANKALVAAGEAPVPIWKTLAKEMFSFNGLIALGTAAVTIFIARMSMQKNALDEAAESLKKYNEGIAEANKSGSVNATKEVVELQLLADQASKATESMDIRLAAVKKLQELYPAYFNDMNKEATLNGNISKEIDEVTAAIYRKANAQAAMSKFEEAAKVDYELHLKERDLQKEMAELLKKAKGGAAGFLASNISLDDILTGKMTIGTSALDPSTGGGKIMSITKQLQELGKERDKLRNEMTTYLADARFNNMGLGKGTPEKEKKGGNGSLLDAENNLAREAYRLQKELLEKELEGQQQIIDNESTSYEKRIEARKRYYDISILLAQAKQKELQEIADNTEAEANKILGNKNASKTDKERAVLMLQKSNLTSQLADATLKNDSEHAATGFQKGLQSDLKAEIARRLTIIKEGDDNVKNHLIVTYANELAMLHKSLDDKQLTREQYNDRVKDLEKKYNVELINIEIDTYEKEYAELKKHGDLTVAQQTEVMERILALKKRKAETENGTQSKPAQDPFKDDAIGSAAFSMFKGFGASEDDAKDAAKQFSQYTIDLAHQTADALKAVEDETYNRRMRDWDMQLKVIRRNADEEIRAINATKKSTVEKANLIATINARTASAEAEIEAKKKQENIRHFNAQQQAARAEIVMNTAVAVANIWKHHSENPILAGILTAMVTGIGIAQMAKVNSATPPAYKHGTKATPRSEHAWVGDGGEKELIEEPGRAPYWSSDKPELRFLPKGTAVTPMSKLVKIAQSHAGQYNMNYSNANSTAAFREVGRGIEGAIEKQTVALAWIHGQKQNVIVEVDNFNGRIAKYL